MHRPIEQPAAFTPASANVIVHSGLVTRTSNLLPDPGLLEYKHKIAYQYFNNNKVVEMNLRRLRQPRKTSPTFLLKKIATIASSTNPDSPARDDR